MWTPGRDCPSHIDAKLNPCGIPGRRGHGRAIKVCYEGVR